MDERIISQNQFKTMPETGTGLKGRVRALGPRTIMLVLVICISCTGMVIAAGNSPECPNFPADYTKCQDSPGYYQWYCLKDDTLNCGACGHQCEIWTEKCTGGNCVETISLTPSFTYSPSSGCIPLEVSFKYSIQTTGGINKWDFDFGDGEPHDWFHSPIHEYKKAGTFYPKLTVTNVGGKSATFTAPTPITVRDCTPEQLANPPPPWWSPLWFIKYLRPLTTLSGLDVTPSPTPVPGLEAGSGTGTVGSGSSDSGADSVQVVVLPGNGEGSTGSTGSGNSPNAEIFVHDTDAGVPLAHMIETPTPVPSPTLPPDAVMSVPTTSIASEPVIVNPASLPCLDGYHRCSGSCVDLMSNYSHCGACNNICWPGTFCREGLCVYPNCDPGKADCDHNSKNGCETDIASDPNHCGSCGTVCPGGVTCISGQCVLQMVTTQPTRLGGLGIRGY